MQKLPELPSLAVDRLKEILFLSLRNESPQSEQQINKLNEYVNEMYVSKLIFEMLEEGVIVAYYDESESDIVLKLNSCT